MEQRNRHGIGMHRADFDKRWEEANKKNDRIFSIAMTFAIIGSILITVAICVGIYLALKNWG